VFIPTSICMSNQELGPPIGPSSCPIAKKIVYNVENISITTGKKFHEIVIISLRLMHPDNDFQDWIWRHAPDLIHTLADRCESFTPSRNDQVKYIFNVSSASDNRFGTSYAFQRWFRMTNPELCPDRTWTWADRYPKLIPSMKHTDKSIFNVISADE